ncbi:MAG TPA: iron transporter, partial [Dehalococcoidia bacterium]|nr:iron transporter [Dehalococcoidia bacterium]
GQMTLIAVFSLIAHNLIIEGIIQHRSGINAVTITLVRIIAAILTVLFVSQFMGDTSESIVGLAEITRDSPITEALKDWALDTLILLAKVFGIIMLIMIVLESLTALGWSEYLFNLSRPLMRLLGLSRRTAMLWVTAVVFGLMYGGAVIQDEAKRGDLTKSELKHLHMSIGINHSMVEDPALFMALGLNGFWLWIPKLVMAAIVVHIFRIIEYLWGKVRGARSKR